MPKTRISCPNCRQPVVAEIDQLFDVGADPSIKQRFLSGAFNLIQCPNCGYQGQLASPIVYHDPDKELLLTFVPPEMGLPHNDQERLIGGLIKQAVDRLPPEKRKAYLLRPQENLTMQGLMEKVLEGEGITREMIQSQQQRLNLIQRLANITTDDVLAEVAKQEDKLIDAEFFTILRRLVEASLSAGDQQSAQGLAELQNKLLPLTTFGQEMQAQSREIEAAMKDLQDAGRELTREKLLELMEQAPSETRLQALVSMARPVLDYQFFQMLSDRIEKAHAEKRTSLSTLRQKLLQMTQQIDQQVEARKQRARQMLDAMVQAEKPGEALIQNIQAVDEFFLQELNDAVEAARKSGDLERLGKLQQLVDIIQQASTPPEVSMIEELIDLPDEAAQRQWLDENWEDLTPEFMSTLANINAQVQEGNDKELAEKFKQLNRLVLKYSMQRNLKG